MRQVYESIARNKLDYEFAEKHNKEVLKLAVKANELADLEEDVLNSERKGGWIQFSFALLKKLLDKNVEAYIAAIIPSNPEIGAPNELYTVVCYKKHGKYLIMDPTFAIRTGQVYMDVPIEQFAKENGYPVTLYDPYGRHGDEIALVDFFDYPFAMVNEDGWMILE